MIEDTRILARRAVPAEHARDLARLAGITPYDVRPDLYDPVSAERPGGAS